MDNVFAWAIVTTEGISTGVEIASEEWIDQNPRHDDTRWVKTDPTTKGYAGIGFTYVEDIEGYGWFQPPQPEEGEWIFDYDPLIWEWIEVNPESS